MRTLVFYTEPEKEEQVAPGLKEMDDQTALSKLAKTSWIMYEYENLTSQAEAEDKNIDKVLVFMHIWFLMISSYNTTC